MKTSSSQLGFSLVELSIVLVILGLLVGGVLTGQSLIRAAELRSVSTEYSRYVAAMRTFQDKYFALPGDMTNATAFWVSAGGNGSINDAACRAVIQTAGHAGTCNGDGDGLLHTQFDGRTFWEHMRLAGLVEGSFYPWTFGTNGATTGVHTPLSKVGNQAGWFACETSRGNFGRPSRNMFVLSSAPWSSSACSAGLSAGISAAEVWNIDTKMDDGLATTGTLTATNSYDGQTDCLTDNFLNEVLASQYEINASRRSCHLYFVMGL